MADVQLKNVYKSFGDTEVLHGVDLEVSDNEFAVFVGPSGCGKSTLLRLIAGLEDLTAGEISIGNERVEHLPPAKRGIAMVFQSYALYPHMNVYQNMSFGLRLAKVSKSEIDRRVREAADILQIEDYLERKPKELSGGQRQRVAIGRAIVREPKVFLFDERGKDWTSTEFSAHLEKLKDNGCPDLVFLIGGADGFTRDVKKAYHNKIRLGSLTWPHKLVRVLAAEQVYRAISLMAGTPYHRE